MGSLLKAAAVSRDTLLAFRIKKDAVDLTRRSMNRQRAALPAGNLPVGRLAVGIVVDLTVDIILARFRAGTL